MNEKELKVFRWAKKNSEALGYGVAMIFSMMSFYYFFEVGVLYQMNLIALFVLLNLFLGAVLNPNDMKGAEDAIEDMMKKIQGDR